MRASDLEHFSTEALRIGLRVLVKRNLTDVYFTYKEIEALDRASVLNLIGEARAKGLVSEAKLSSILTWAKNHATKGDALPTYGEAPLPPPPQPPKAPQIESMGDAVKTELVKLAEFYVETANKMLSPANVKALVASEIEGAKIPVETIITVKAPGKKSKTLEGATHETQADLTMALAAGVHVYLVGPAGTGKTTGAHKAADALGLPFYCISVCAQTTASVLLGYMDAHGKYVGTVFRTAFEHGGVFLLDEIDNGNANVLAVLNAALANGVCAFPDGMVKRSENFRCVAAGNTWGTGRTMEYVGRNPIDAATLDRFAFVEWSLDEKLEDKTSQMVAWRKFVQAFRRHVKEAGIKHLVTPRATYHGEKLIAQGMPVARAATLTLCKGMELEQFERIVKSAGGLPKVKTEQEA